MSRRPEQVRLRAAVPDFVFRSCGEASPGQSDRDPFAKAPPGHRFRLYWSAWREDGFGGDDKGGARKSLDLAAKLPPEARRQAEALVERRARLPEVSHREVLAVTCETTAPLLVGLGAEHPNENGFAFLDPYGLPYLPGSSVKGVLRDAGAELAGDAGSPWEPDDVVFLFGPEPGTEDHERGALVCFDGLVLPPRGQLHVDVLNPHHRDYYRGEVSKENRGGQPTPHDAENPVPVYFLAVPPGARVHFAFAWWPPAGRSPRASWPGSGHWRTLVQEALEHSVTWLGFGAKTAVGYGRMVPTGAASGRTGEPRGGGGRRDAAAAGAHSGAPDIEVWRGATVLLDPGSGTLTAVSGERRAYARGEEAAAIRGNLSEEQRRRLERKKKRRLANVTVRVRVAGSSCVLVVIEEEPS